MDNSSAATALPRPYFEDDAVTIYHGDCREIAPSLAPLGYPTRVITDPPYGSGTYDTDVAQDLELLSSWITGYPTVTVFGYPELLAYWCVAMGQRPNEWVTWWPTNKFGMGDSPLLPRETEHIAVFGAVVGARLLMRPRSEQGIAVAAKAGRKNPTEARLGDVWRDASPGTSFNSHLRLHPNEKPLGLMHKLTVLCSEQGDLIFDPYCGSGTTLLAAKTIGRKAIGIEIEERYCEIAALRMGQEVLDLAV